MSSSDVALVAVISALPIAHVVDRIEKLNTGLAKFWKNSSGWAPVEAAGLLTAARLDWQASLSSTLRIWQRDPPSALTSGELILAWANLGSLIEGTLKLLLSVHYADYKKDLEALKYANAYDHKVRAAKTPDGLMLDHLIKFVRKRDLIEGVNLNLADKVQKRRNTIHAFQDKPLGDGVEFQAAVRGYLGLLREVSQRLPYPDDQYEPREV